MNPPVNIFIYNIANSPKKDEKKIYKFASPKACNFLIDHFLLD